MNTKMIFLTLILRDPVQEVALKIQCSNVSPNMEGQREELSLKLKQHKVVCRSNLIFQRNQFFLK